MQQRPHSDRSAAMSRLRHSIMSIATVFVALVLALFALELALRAFDFEPLRDLARGKDLVLRPSVHPEIGYELTPGAEGEAFHTQVRVNASGFRGPELRTDSGLRRILVLGDSIAFGSEIPAGTAFPDLLRDRFAGAGFEVVNLALSGYDTLQEVAVLELRGLALVPELVILGYCLNDAGVVSANAEYLQRVERYRESFWITRSRVVQLVATRMDRLRGRTWEREQNLPDVFHSRFAGRIDALGTNEHDLARWMSAATDVHPSAWYRDADRVGRIRHGFRRLAELSAREGFAVLVVIFPWLETAPHGAYPHTAVHRIVAYEAARQSFGVLDLTAAFSAAELASLRNDPDDPTHPNPEGHRIAAQEIVGWLEAGGWHAATKTMQPLEATDSASLRR